MQSLRLWTIGALILFRLAALPVSAQSFWIQGIGTITTDSITVANSALLVITGEPGGLFYTMDGTDPTPDSTRYTAAIPLSYGTHDIRAVTYSADLSQESRRRLFIIVAPTFSLEVRTPFPDLVTVSAIPRPQNGQYFSNSLVTITARSENGWLFKEFRDMRKTTEPQIQFNLKSNVFMNVIYQTKFNATQAGPGAVTVAPAKEFYEHGEQVTLHANPNPRCFFSSWSLENNKYAPWVHTITEPNQTVTGNFKEAQEGQFVLHTDVLGGGGVIGTSLGRYVFFPGETVTVTCGRINGAFYGWVEGFQSQSRALTFQVNSDMKLVARADRIFQWSKELEHDSNLQPPAVGHDGTIYVASESYLWAVSPEGDIQWAITAPGLTGPAIGPSGSLYLASPDGIVSYQADGSFRWRRSGGRAPIAIDASENIYFLEGTQLVSLTKDAELRWKTTDAPVAGSPVISSNGVILVIHKTTWQVRAYNLDGVYLWSGPSKGSAGEAAVGADGTFVYQYGDFFHSLSEAGKTNWTVKFTRSHGEHGITIGQSGNAYVGFSQIFVDPTPFWVYTISPEGEVTGERFGSSRPPLVDSAGLLTYISGDTIDLINPDGSYVYQAQVEGSGAGATFGVDNTIYYTSRDSELNAVRSLNGPLMNTWTTYRGNPQRTGSILPQTIDLPPSLPIIDGQTSQSGGSVELEILVSDDNTSAEDIQVVAVSLDEGLLPNENLALTGDGSSRTLSIAIPQDVTGIVRIRVTASDGTGHSVEREFLIQIEAPLPAPELLINLVPALTLKGVPGEQYRIEAQPDVTGADWVTLTEVTLTNELQHVYVDLSVLNADPRFYRAVLIE